MPWSILIALMALLAGACSDDGAGTSTADTDGDGGGDLAPDGSGETEPPRLRDLRVTIEGELGSEVDLTRGDEVRVLPESSPAEFRVFADDNESAAADLDVRVINNGPTELGDQTAEFRNGLWNITVAVEGGMALGVEVEDEAGNVISSEYSLLLPTQEEAVVGDWERRFFTEDQVTTHRWTSTYLGDGTWTQEQLDTGIEQGGDWWLDDDERLHIAETVRTDPGDGASDDDASTVEWESVSGFYVDDRYFASGPLAADGDGADLVDAWSRTVERYEPDVGGDLQLVEERTETIVFGSDDSWFETWTGTTYEGMTETSIDRSWAGTYRVELNENYTENIGDFIVRTVDEIDGEAVSDEPDRWDLHVTRLGRLLVNPRLHVVE